MVKKLHEAWGLAQSISDDIERHKIEQCVLSIAIQYDNCTKYGREDLLPAISSLIDLVHEKVILLLRK